MATERAQRILENDPTEESYAALSASDRCSNIIFQFVFDMSVSEMILLLGIGL